MRRGVAGRGCFAKRSRWRKIHVDRESRRPATSILDRAGRTMVRPESGWMVSRHARARGLIVTR
jgi:hypothetical protein